MAQRVSPNRAEANSVLNSFRCIVKSLRQADRAAVREHGVGASQLYVLHELSRQSPLSVNDLADRMATDQSTVSVVVSSLIEKGLVRRERSKEDARRTELELTAEGRRTVKRLPAPIQRTLIEGVEQLPRATAKALAEALTEICRTLGIDEEHPPMLFDNGPEPKKRTTRSPR